MLLIIVMGIAQFGMVLNAYLALNNAVREGARAGITGSSDAEIMHLMMSASPVLDESHLEINITPLPGSRISGNTLTVEANYNYQLTVPVINLLFNDTIVLHAKVSMRIE
ncbi:MAG TPA: pilus assembly protein [Clostridiaceae bacterium]|nr:pilus assembly protein [Clostridiaceae bacterium]